MRKSALVALSALSLSAFGAAFAVPASADVYASALNANESLALFGTSIQALYYDGVGVESCTFDYVGNTFDVKQYAVDLYNAGGNGTFPYNQDIGGRGTYLGTTTYDIYDDQNSPSFFTTAFIEGTNYLIYRCAFDSGLPASASNFDFQIQVDTSIGIQAQALAFSCLWTCPDGLVNRTGNTASHLYLYNESGFPAGEIASVIGARPSNSDWSGRYWFGHIGAYLSDVLNYSGNNPDPKILLLNQQPTFCGCFVRAGNVTDEDAQGISFTGFRLNCKNVQSTYRYNFDYTLESYVADGTTKYVYLLLQCPWVYGDFVLPEPEDNTTLGDINSNIDSLVLSTDELRQILLRMESVQQDIKTAETVHTAQFIDMISRLDAIYNAMDFDVPALQYAQTLPVDENAMQTVESALSDYEFPEYLEENEGVSQAASGFSGLLDGLKNAIPGKVWNFIWFSIACGLIHWLLFHGRGS